MGGGDEELEEVGGLKDLRAGISCWMSAMLMPWYIECMDGTPALPRSHDGPA